MAHAEFRFPRAVIFDMDGLMLNSEVIFHQAWQETLVELGYGQLDRSTYLQLVGCSNNRAEQLLVNLLGDNFPVEQFHSGWTARWETLAAKGIPVKPGLEALLDWLEAIDLPKAVGTSSSDREAEISLHSTGLWSRFKTVVTVDRAGGEGKPAPDIFLTAAQILNIAPTQCLILEDSNAGVQAAVAAGMQAIMVPDLQTPTDYSQRHACRIMSSLCDVLGHLQLHWERV